MKKQVKHVVLVLAMVTSLGLVAPALAGALPALRLTTGATSAQMYRIAVFAYNHERFLINQAFHLAAAQARKVEIAQLHLAKSAARKSVVRANYREAIVSATTKWQDALAALGNPPQPPVSQRPVTTTIS